MKKVIIATSLILGAGVLVAGGASATKYDRQCPGNLTVAHNGSDWFCMNPPGTHRTGAPVTKIHGGGHA